MAKIPAYEIRVYGNEDRLPAEAEELLAKELAGSREPLPAERADRDQWRFRCVCALTKSGRVLGGAHMDMGPINFGPLGKEKLAYLEHVFVQEEYRRQGVGTEVFQKLIQVAKAAGCQYIRYNVSWDNAAGIALSKKCGFALTDISEPDQGGEYFTVKPLQGYGCNV